MKLQLALVTVALAVASCAPQTPPAATSTVTVTVSASITSTASPPTTLADVPPPLTTTAQTTTASSGYSQEGAYAVGTQPSGGLQAAILPGRYRVEWKPNEYDFPGTVMRCNSHECSPMHTENMIAAEQLVKGQLPAVIDIAPTDVAVYLLNVTLTPVG